MIDEEKAREDITDSFKHITTTEVSESELGDLLCVLRDVANYAARNHCGHEETYRGGAIWEICSQCGMKCADDEGGKPDDAGDLPDELERAYEMLAKYDA